MGNSLNFFMKHGKRLKNRYNAQYRALEFISKENRPSAPRHPVPVEKVVKDASFYEKIYKKDLNLDKYLKDVYLRSDQIPQDSFGSQRNPERPLPESREPKPKATFIEPEEVEKGYCTITHISEFLASHDEDPVENSAAHIAKTYSLEEKKVENTVKYFSVFRIFDNVRDTLPTLHDPVEAQTFSEGMEELKSGAEKAKQYLKSIKSSAKGVEDSGGKQESPVESREGSQPMEKAVKN